MVIARKSALERSEDIAEWIRLTELKAGGDTNEGTAAEGKESDLQLSQLATIESKRADGRGHRHEGGILAAARELNIDKDAAHRSVAIASLPPEAPR